MYLTKEQIQYNLESEAKEKLSKLGIYGVEKVSENHVNLDFVNFDFDFNKRRDFTIVMSRDGKFNLFQPKGDDYFIELDIKVLNYVYDVLKQVYFK